MSNDERPATPDEQRDAFIERLIQSVAGTFDIFTIYVGSQLGYYKALTGGALSSGELAAQTGTQERYAREWLEQQTVSGILAVEDADLGAEERRYFLPPGRAEVLTASDSLNYMAPLVQILVGVTRPLPALLDAYRNGGGVALDEYGRDFREGQAGCNRAAFLQQLSQEWLPAVPDVDARLKADPPARIADIGCGYGWSSIGMATGYPKARVDGFDLDGPSIEAAKANATAAGLADRVHFQEKDAGSPDLVGRYDLVTAFECVHDMSDPVLVLRVMRQMAADGGAVIIADERVGDQFTATGNDVEWMMYGWSVLHCLPVGMDAEHSVGTGTVMRTGTLREYATAAGFRDVEVLPIDNYFFRFYRLLL